MFVINGAECFVLFHRTQQPEGEQTSDPSDLVGHITRNRPSRLANSSSVAASSQRPESNSSNWSTIGNPGTPTATTFGVGGNDANTRASTESGALSFRNISSDAASGQIPPVGHSDSATSPTLTNASEPTCSTSASSHTLSASSRTLSASSRTLSASSHTLSASSRTLSASSRTLSASSHTPSASSRTISDASCSDYQSAVTYHTLPNSPHVNRDFESTTANGLIEGRRTQASNDIYVPRPRSDSETTCHPLDAKHWGKK